MKLKKKIFSLMLAFVLVCSTFTGFTYGQEDAKSPFTDVPTTHWAYKDIKMMSDLGIINGHPGDLFKPDDSVTRGQFAKMMVLTLGLDLKNPSTASFADVNSGDWEYKYIETAKYYLTGFRDMATGTLTFKSNRDAVREDMAVGIVKGLNLTASTNLSGLDKFTDKGEMSTNLKGYIARAVSEDIMIGSEAGGKWKFNAQSPLTRAQAATLFARLIHEEKVTFDEEKVIIEEEKTQGREPKLKVTEADGQLVLEWTGVDSEKFKYYKVVGSETVDFPKYPTNGYSHCTKENRVVLKSGTSYHGGDVGGAFKGGTTYNFSITAVYEDENVAGNVVRKKMPGSYVEVSDAEKTPKLTANVGSSGVELNWSQVHEQGFQGYKVVVSIGNPAPVYPADGYAKYITNISEVTYYLKDGQSYNKKEGDVDGIKSGQQYYISITALYSDGKYKSNAVRCYMP